MSEKNDDDVVVDFNQAKQKRQRGRPQKPQEDKEQDYHDLLEAARRSRQRPDVVRPQAGCLLQAAHGRHADLRQAVVPCQRAYRVECEVRQGGDGGAG